MGRAAVPAASAIPIRREETYPPTTLRPPVLTDRSRSNRVLGQTMLLLIAAGDLSATDLLLNGVAIAFVLKVRLHAGDPSKSHPMYSPR